MSSLSEYELERLSRIEANAQLLASLGLVPLSASLPKPSLQTLRSKIQIPKAPIAPASDRPKRTRNSLSVQDTQGSSFGTNKRRYSDASIEYDSADDYSDEPNYIRPRKASKRAYEKGGRFYDPVNGTSCHQCRQKTLDAKASCTASLIDPKTKKKYSCPIKICYRCLPNRYGQSLSEQFDHGAWTCPKCLGTCNCSFCMKRRGLHPTGIAINLARQKGFESVHDMLQATPKSSHPKSSRATPSSPFKERRTRQATTTSMSTRKRTSKTKPLSYQELDEDEDDIDESEYDAAKDDGQATIQLNDEPDQEYQVEEIVSFSIDPLRFHVRWLNFGPEYDTQEPLETVVDLEAMDTFEGTDPTTQHNDKQVSLVEAISAHKQGQPKRKLKKRRS